jgi:membrane protease YdiL (CAAX protease family)
MSTTEIGTSFDRPPAQTLRERWIDLVFVIAVCLWHPLIASTYVVVHGSSAYQAGHPNLVVFGGILNELIGLMVLFYVLYRRHATVSYFGRKAESKDILRAIGLYLVQAVAMFLIAYVYAMTYFVSKGHFPTHIAAAKLLGIHASALWLIYTIVGPCFEELVVRGFLMTELSTLVSVPVAVIASTLIQASYHLYQGVENVLMLAGVFLVSSLYYARTRRLMPVILAHLILDLLALARVAFHR